MVQVPRPQRVKMNLKEACVKQSKEALALRTPSISARDSLWLSVVAICKPKYVVLFLVVAEQVMLKLWLLFIIPECIESV